VAPVERPAELPAAVAKRIDQAIEAKLAALKLAPGTRSDDAEFLRRVSLDIVGKPQVPPQDVSITIPNDGEARNGNKKVPAAFLDHAKLAVDPAKSHRPPFAAWLPAKNIAMFAQAAVNRMWAHFFARGFVNPLNDFGDHNTPSRPVG
jgi:hypothetical protein